MFGAEEYIINGWIGTKRQIPYLHSLEAAKEESYYFVTRLYESPKKLTIKQVHL